MPAEILAEAIAFLKLTDIGPLAQANRHLSELTLAHGYRITWRFQKVQANFVAGRPDIRTSFLNNEAETICIPKASASEIFRLALRNCVIDAYYIACVCRGDPLECCAATLLKAVRRAAVVKRVHLHLCCFAEPKDLMTALGQVGKLKLSNFRSASAKPEAAWMSCCGGKKLGTFKVHYSPR